MMKATQNPLRRISSRAIIVLCLGLFVSAGVPARAASWSGIEPLRSRRADVERALGAPVNEQPDNAGALVFRVAGGTVTVSFADARFVQSRNLGADAVGTVLQIVLQHENANETPESLNLIGNRAFRREQRNNIVAFTNERDGLVYLFIDNRLRTTRYTPTLEQLGRGGRGRGFRTIF
jgi:hypothetical protein